MNAATSLHFFPAGGFSNPGYNKTVECPGSGIDADCAGDKYEACILQEYCSGVACEPPAQLKLASFLDCFEGRSGSKMSAADGCAKGAGLSVERVRKCYDSAEAKAAAWQVVQKAASVELSGITCFPWIEVAGSVVSDPAKKGCFGEDAATTPLLPLLCKGAKEEGISPPAACASFDEP